MDLTTLKRKRGRRDRRPETLGTSACNAADFGAALTETGGSRWSATLARARAGDGETRRLNQRSGAPGAGLVVLDVVDRRRGRRRPLVRVACEDALYGRAPTNRGTATSAAAVEDLGGTQNRQRFEPVHGRVHGEEEDDGQKLCAESDMDGKHGKDGNGMALTLGSLIHADARR